MLGCAESLLLCVGFSGCGKRGLLFSLQLLLLLQSSASRALGLQQPQYVVSVVTAPGSRRGLSSCRAQT